MHRLLLAVIMALGGPGLALAASPIGHTNLSFDDQHGTQVEYLSRGGGAFLWYPGNTVILPGHWKMEAGGASRPAQICFKYGPNSYNPVTHVYGDVWECEDMRLYTALLTEQAKGDVLNLAHRRVPPFRLSRARATLEQLAKQAGMSARLGRTSMPSAPTAPRSADSRPAAVVGAHVPAGAATGAAACAAFLAHVPRTREEMIVAGLSYYHGEYYGQHCIKVDFVKAFDLLRRAGDKNDATSLLADLRLKASTGNPMAINGLRQLGLQN